MILNDQIKKYLKDEVFSNEYTFVLGNHKFYECNEVLVELVKDKKLLHLGCADHINLIGKEIDRKSIA